MKVFQAYKNQPKGLSTHSPPIQSYSCCLLISIYQIVIEFDIFILHVTQAYVQPKTAI